MLSSRNRSLKRRSRFAAFFVIVFAGCLYRLRQLYEAIRQYTSTDQFMKESPLLPETFRTLYIESQQVNVKRSVLGQRLPAEDMHEMRYRMQQA